ncbi:MAG TPA: potassium channel family protein [Gaiellales bacterium]|jgi:hypothetical protein|nr:potassium channel family protein [Gaiellales bacterium]
MTTVGYGDQYPQTIAGRAIAIVVMLVGIGFIAIMTAAVVERFVAAGVATEIEHAELETEQDLVCHRSARHRRDTTRMTPRSPHLKRTREPEDRGVR